MQSIKPKTYNELMVYSRCLQLRQIVPNMDDALFLKIYHHMLTSNQNSISISEGNMVFYAGDQSVDYLAAPTIATVTSVTLTATALNIVRPYTDYSGSDGGSGGNNNNNNNNNNG